MEKINMRISLAAPATPAPTKPAVKPVDKPAPVAPPRRSVPVPPPCTAPSVPNSPDPVRPLKPSCIP